ncbi:hypothetical protein [Streptomyces sp. NPDC055692]|uniref:hypothetical protein n=1 Tax=Streptomyces sp. NPDC055692 TaxID=3155683 RepID=UPI003428250F
MTQGIITTTPPGRATRAPERAGGRPAPGHEWPALDLAGTEFDPIVAELPSDTPFDRLPGPRLAVPAGQVAWSAEDDDPQPADLAGQVVRRADPVTR